MNAIAIPANNRPAFLKQVFASIFAAHGSKDWTIALCPESTPQRGCRANTHRACQLAVENGAEWVLYLEDDVVLSPDALLLCAQFVFARLDGILCLRRWHDTQDAAHPALARPADHGLLGDGFLFPRERWPWLSEWWFRDEPGMGGRMWDWSVSWALSREGVPQWRPLVNRSRNIGVHGTHSTSGADFNHFGPAYSGDPVTRFTFTP